MKPGSHAKNQSLAGWLAAVAVLLTSRPCPADVKGDFVNPPLKFRPRPLWFWNNTAVTAAGVEAQLQGKRDRSGYGGLAPLPFGAKFTPKYLSEEYFSLYGAAVNKARQLGMFLTIYDEYGFPSGSGGAAMGDGIPRFMNQFPNATLRRLDKHEATAEAESCSFSIHPRKPVTHPPFELFPPGENRYIAEGQGGDAIGAN